MNRRVPIAFNQYPCYENILLFLCASLAYCRSNNEPICSTHKSTEWKYIYAVYRPKKTAAAVRNRPREKLKPDDDFDENNDMQKVSY